MALVAVAVALIFARAEMATALLAESTPALERCIRRSLSSLRVQPLIAIDKSTLVIERTVPLGGIAAPPALV